jgi:hypothetical protein
MVLALVLAVPGLVHVLEPANARSIGTSDKLPDGDTLEKQLRQIPQLPIGKSFN